MGEYSCSKERQYRKKAKNHLSSLRRRRLSVGFSRKGRICAGRDQQFFKNLLNFYFIKFCASIFFFFFK